MSITRQRLKKALEVLEEEGRQYTDASVARVEAYLSARKAQATQNASAINKPLIGEFSDKPASSKETKDATGRRDKTAYPDKPYIGTFALPSDKPSPAEGEKPPLRSKKPDDPRHPKVN